MNLLIHFHIESIICKIPKFPINVNLSRCFATLSKITVNPAGKQEAIDEQVIETANNFLKSNNPEEVHYAVVLIMNCTIHLDGKKQCVEYRDHIVIKVL